MAPQRKEAAVDVLIALVFVSLVLVVGGLIFLYRTLKEGDSEHADRLSLMPLAKDEENRERQPQAETSTKPKENS